MSTGRCTTCGAEVDNSIRCSGGKDCQANQAITYARWHEGKQTERRERSQRYTSILGSLKPRALCPQHAGLCAHCEVDKSLVDKDFYEKEYGLNRKNLHWGKHD